MNLTKNEKAMLQVFYSESIDCCGACEVDGENMSYCNAQDLQNILGWDKQTIGGVMSSLLSKNMIEDTGDSARGENINDFCLTNDGIRAVESIQAEPKPEVTQIEEPKEDKKRNLVEWCDAFKQGQFEKVDIQTQIDAGWYDWFCTDKSLARRLAGMGPKVVRIARSEKFDASKCYVFFKNNMPVVGDLYDDFRICDRESGDVLYTVSSKNIDGKRVNEVWGRDNNFNSAVVSGSMKDIYTFFGV